jgi:hypothetical protein
MKSYVLILFSLVIILGSCSKENITSTKVSSGLTGEWNWVYSSGGIAVTTYTPKSTGETRRIEFDTNGVFRSYVNNILATESKYKLVKSRTIYSQDSALLIIRASSMPQNFMIRSSDTLILMDECFDCFEHLYTRIK